MELKEFIEKVLADYRHRLFLALDGLTPEELAWRPGPEANSIAFIVWHVARIEDRWFQRFAQEATEVWIRGGWAQKTGISEHDTGGGYTAEQLAQFPVVKGEDLRQYFEAVRKETLSFLRGLEPKDFDFAPERPTAPDRPRALSGKAFEGCTIGRMFRQIVAEFNQHLGQVQYLRGLQRGINNVQNTPLP
jgi:hypothetical protein